MAEEKLVVGGEHTIYGHIYDVVAGVPTLLDLTGVTVKIRARIEGGTPKEWDAVIENQTTDKGGYHYDLAGSTPGPADLDVKGTLEIQAVATLSGKEYPSEIEFREVLEAI